MLVLSCELKILRSRAAVSEVLACPQMLQKKAVLSWAVSFSVLCCDVRICSKRAFEVLGWVLSDGAAAMCNV